MAGVLRLPQPSPILCFKKANARHRLKWWRAFCACELIRWRKNTTFFLICLNFLNFFFSKVLFIAKIIVFLRHKKNSNNETKQITRISRNQTATRLLHVSPVGCVLPNVSRRPAFFY